MLRLSKKADYALISLAYMAEHRGRVVSAREIAQQRGLPAALLMNLLKAMHQRGILRSTRGATGGYQIAADLTQVSLLDLSRLLEREDCDGDETADPSKRMAIHRPAQALQFRLMGMMRDVSVADLVLPGRRIDVPIEGVGVNSNNKPMIGSRV